MSNQGRPRADPEPQRRGDRVRPRRGLRRRRHLPRPAGEQVSRRAPQRDRRRYPTADPEDPRFFKGKAFAIAADATFVIAGINRPDGDLLHVPREGRAVEGVDRRSAHSHCNHRSVRAMPASAWDELGDGELSNSSARSSSDRRPSFVARRLQVDRVRRPREGDLGQRHDQAERDSTDYGVAIQRGARISASGGKLVALGAGQAQYTEIAYAANGTPISRRPRSSSTPSSASATSIRSRS